MEATPAVERDGNTGRGPAPAVRMMNDGQASAPAAYAGAELKAQDRSDDRLARALGWASLGLGIADALVPRRLARLIGVSDTAGNAVVLRVAGIREIASGIGILVQPRPVGWVWARVVGDGMDLFFLARQLTRSDSAQRRPIGIALASVGGLTALDVRSGLKLLQQNARRPEQKGIVREAITINRPTDEVYAFWRDFQNFPRFMQNIEAVTPTIGEHRTHWRARTVAGRSVEWDAEITDDRPNERIAWRSVEGSDVMHAGEVAFRPAPGGRGTEVMVELRYQPPGGSVGQTVARLLGREPGQQVGGDLRRLKQVIETGEVLRSDATLDGPQLPHRPAQPPESAPDDMPAAS